VIKVFSGYEDGLIIQHEFPLNKAEKGATGFKALIGHTNKINSMSFEINSLFSSSQDCTVR
jgi:hypothetical protein